MTDAGRLTDEEFDRLPLTAKKIVAADRALARWRGRDVVDFEKWKNIRANRAEWVRDAERVWGSRRDRDGTAPA